MKEEPSEVDAPSEFYRLTDGEQASLLSWIIRNFMPAKSVYRTSSYGLKHEFGDSTSGFYVTNGAFKGAMLLAGFKPANGDKNWLFKIKKRQLKALGSLHDRMRLAINLLEQEQKQDPHIIESLWNAIYDLQTLVMAIPDVAFEKGTDRVVPASARRAKRGIAAFHANPVDE